VQLALQEVDLALGQLGLSLLQALLRDPLLALLVVELGLQTAELLETVHMVMMATGTSTTNLLLLSDLDEHFVDFHLPVFLQCVEVVIRHLVELGVGDVVQQLQDVREGGPLVGVAVPAC
jgi:hypothetical protein